MRAERTVAVLVALAASTTVARSGTPEAVAAVPGVVAATSPAQQAGAPVTLPDPEPSPADARRRADEIMARPEYQEPEPSLLERFMEWLGERTRDLLERVPPAPAPGAVTGGSPVLAWIVVAVLLALVAFLVWRWRGAGLRRRRARRADDPLSLSESEARRVPDEWIAEAERLERDGRWKDALRCRFRALIGELAERGSVHDLPGRTSGELRADVRRAAPEIAPGFSEASGLFDAAWYGGAPTGPAECARFGELAAAILAATPHPATGAVAVGASAGAAGGER